MRQAPGRGNGPGNYNVTARQFKGPHEQVNMNVKYDSEHGFVFFSGHIQWCGCRCGTVVENLIGILSLI